MASISNSKLYNNTEGIPKIKDALIVIIKTEWNAEIVDALEAGCFDILHQHGIKTKTLVVPGAIEIPFTIKQCWNQWSKKKKPNAFIALGSVVRGDTPHFEYVCQSVTQGITQLNLELPVPVVFGVLTVNNVEQAKERIGGVHGHKGEEAAITAIKMMVLNNQLNKV